jgi:long-chain acyl-CoA synthetase
MFAPNYIENKLKFFPFIKEAVAFGHQRDQVRLHQHRHGSRGQLGRTAQHRLFRLHRPGRPSPPYGLVRDCIEQVNADLAADPLMGARRSTASWCCTRNSIPTTTN